MSQWKQWGSPERLAVDLRGCEDKLGSVSGVSILEGLHGLATVTATAWRRGLNKQADRAAGSPLRGPEVGAVVGGCVASWSRVCF